MKNKTLNEAEAIKIEKGIPTPDRAYTKHPWRSMKVGDSFFVIPRNTATIRAGAYSAGIRYGMKFTCQQIGNGIRVWRIK